MEKIWNGWMVGSPVGFTPPSLRFPQRLVPDVAGTVVGALVCSKKLFLRSDMPVVLAAGRAGPRLGTLRNGGVPFDHSRRKYFSNN